MYDDLYKKILIIEDDLVFRNPLRDFLSANNFAISLADDGEQAMDKLLVHRPDIIILDLLLPKIDGFEVLHRIRTYPDESIANIPIIILSNVSSNDGIEKAEGYKIEAYFVKSHTKFNEVLKKIKEILLIGEDSMPSLSQDDVLDFTNPSENK
jgi:two-component system, OmpR family, response regulator MprA